MVIRVGIFEYKHSKNKWYCDVFTLFIEKYVYITKGLVPYAK